MQTATLLAAASQITRPKRNSNRLLRLEPQLPLMVFVYILTTGDSLISYVFGCYHAKELVLMGKNVPAEWKYVVNKSPTSLLKTHHQPTVALASNLV